MKALVLGGGSLKGAWQAGAIQAVLETGFKPEMIYGISAGALNASFMVSASALKDKVDWVEINKELLRFWIENIKEPADIGLSKSRVSLGIDTLWSRFDGLIDTSPLDAKIKTFVNLENLLKSPIKLKVGAVDINTGIMHYIDKSEKYFHDYLRASSSLPIIMPGIAIGGNHKKIFLDGGVREVVPLKKALEDGATEVVCIATHPEKPELEPINHRSLFSLIERIKDISVNQFENSDLQLGALYTEELWGLGSYGINKKPKITVIRPSESIKINITSFKTTDVKRVIKDGYTKAYEIMKVPS
jgi:NTE family protein